MAIPISRRRTFAIISHPDAGKTTLTEKFLLYGGAVQLAGSVKARKHQRETTSDWMELERQRGISVSSTVLQFDYDGCRLNLLDTPGHRDFSEDTYRVLTAVDSAVMVIDGAKGIEQQTRKLFEVCRRRHIPIFTFINKCDRPIREPLDLLDELARVLGIEAFAMNWPLGSGDRFRGVYDRRREEVHLFEKTVGGAYRAPVAIHTLSDPSVRDRLDPETHAAAVEELAVLQGAGATFSQTRIIAGELTPVFFGSATNNFGVQLMLDGFLALSVPPVGRQSNGVLIDPSDSRFSGFVFKIQGNMDPRHRDHVAFVRVCSGRFERDMPAIHTRTGRRIKLGNSHKLFGQEREIVNEAWPGDIVGLVGHADIKIGDTLASDETIAYREIPRFPPECFAFLHNPSPAKFKPFRKGLDQLLAEGIVRAFYPNGFPRTSPLLGAVGPLQFDVVQFRLLSEYGAESRIEPSTHQFVRWLDGRKGAAQVSEIRLPVGTAAGEDGEGNPVLFFESPWALGYFRENHPGIVLHELSPADQSMEGETAAPSVSR